MSSDITLHSVYHVPNFAYNLLSVDHLAKNLNCDVIFLLDSCFLQDLTSKKVLAGDMSTMDSTTMEALYLPKCRSLVCKFLVYPFLTLLFFLLKF